MKLLLPIFVLGDELTKFLESHKGMNNLVYALLVVPMLLIISTAIFTNFGTNINRSGWTTDANDTYDEVNDQTWSGFQLGALLPYVLISVSIIGAILGAFGLTRMLR